MSQPLIIDTDCGVDDAFAILLALSRRQDWSVEAISCCRGVTDVDNVVTNVLRILNYVGYKEIPVYKGCDKPILDNEAYETDFHGKDGLGNASSSLPLSPDQKPQSDYAPVGLIRHVSQRPGEITLLAIGPLTNLAIAHRLEPRFSSYVKQLVVMGGNADGIGNQTAMAEFNFYVDPEAAQIVLSEFRCPITVYPWEACLEQPIGWPWFDKWIEKDTKVCALLRRISELSLKLDRETFQSKGYLSPDGIAAACCLYPEKVVAACTKARGVAVELGGQHCRGLMVQDKRQMTKDPEKEDRTVTVVTAVNMKEVIQLFEHLNEDTWLEG